METVKIPNIDTEVSRLALGTWSIGGVMWGGSDADTSFKTIMKALDKGINFIDSAASYGNGASEELIGKALKEYGERENLIVATKGGLEFGGPLPTRNSSKDRIRKEIDDSLRRLQTDYVDIYQIHWPDPLVPFEETASVMQELLDAGKIRAVGVSNYTVENMQEFSEAAPIHTCQPPYNLFERDIERDVKHYCDDNEIAILAYSSICRGLLSGKINESAEFEGDDVRKNDPKFEPPRFRQYLDAVRDLDQFALNNYGKNVMSLALRWILDKDVEVALLGARKPEQLDIIDEVFGWELDYDAMDEIERILADHINDPVGPEFMAPPARER